MLISETGDIAGARVVRPIGKITAVSAWRRPIVSPDAAPLDDERMLRELIRRAEDVDADAIVAVSYAVEPLVRESGIALERTCVMGIAVRVLVAA